MHSGLAGFKTWKAPESGWTAYPSDYLLLPNFDGCWRPYSLPGSTDVLHCRQRHIKTGWANKQLLNYNGLT